MNLVGFSGKLPEMAPSEEENDEDILKTVHHALIEVEVTEGFLVCPESGREFPITNGIPNMLLNEDEV
jgi:multifunctional methyltransferase subunit TRM112